MCSEEGYMIPWWPEITRNQKEIFEEGVNLIRKILGVRAANDPRRRQLRILTDICQPIIRNGGCIPENLQFVQLCENLGVNHMELPGQMQEYFNNVTGSLDTNQASEILSMSPRKVRHMIAAGLLPANKIHDKWSIKTIEALRLAYDELPYQH